MSPLIDPSYSAKRQTVLQKEREESERATRMEYIKPLAMFAIGIPIVIVVMLSEGDSEISGMGLVFIYAVTFAFSLGAGVAGLWLASHLWLGGAGPLFLCILRLAGIYAITDAVGQFAGGLMMLSWLIPGVVYMALLMWLFELEPGESLILAMITYVLKVAAAVVLMLAAFSG